MRNNKRAYHIAYITKDMGYGIEDLIKLRELAWNCLPFSCFVGGIDTKVFDDINEAIKILESDDK